MSQPTVAERLAGELPPDGSRRILARLEDMRGRAETGPLATLKVDENGEIIVEVQEVYAWGRNQRTLTRPNG